VIFMNQDHLYVWLKKQYLDFGFDYQLIDVIEIAEPTGLSYDEIWEAYDDFKSAQPHLQPDSFID
jgi:hypothetical protein